MHLRMKVVRGKPRGHFLMFPPGDFMFGRGPECDVRPNSDLISRQHCLLHITEVEAMIRDLGSMNGTLVNGQLVNGERKLSHGDTLQLGSLVLQVVMENEPEANDASISDGTIEALSDETKLGPIENEST